jgi:hypothetical protein
MYFPRLAVLTPEAATALARHAGRGLVLDGLTELPVELAAALAGHPARLHLKNVAILSVAAAEALVDHPGELQLQGLRELPADVATALAKLPKRNLVLDHVREISAETAAAFSDHRGILYLGGIKALDDAAAAALAKHPGPLQLRGLETVSAEAAALAANPKIVLPERLRR